MVVLNQLPPGLIDGLPQEDQEAITAIVGQPVLLLGYEELGRAKLKFTDSSGVTHFIWVEPGFIGARR
jgi:hypothetical protein